MKGSIVAMLDIGKTLIPCERVIQMDIGGHPPFPTGSKHRFDIFGNLIFLAVSTSGAILRA
jgi:hypothetical protein